MRNVRAFLRTDAAARIGSHEFPCSLSSAEKLSTLGTRGALRLRPRFRCCCRPAAFIVAERIVLGDSGLKFSVVRVVSVPSVPGPA